MGDFVEVLSDDVAKMSAARMQHNTAHTVIILLYLDEVISSAESSCLIVALVNLWNKLLISLVAAHLALRAVEHFRWLRRFVMSEPSRDISQDISTDSLNQISASRDSFSKK